MESRVLQTSFTEDGTLLTILTGNISQDRVSILEQDVATARALIREEFLKRGIKFKSLIDLTQFGGTYVPHAVAVLAEYMKANKPYIAKSAGFGGGETTTLAGNIVATLAGRDNIGFFKTKDEALAWLNA